jgi:hypothetical protein
MMLTRYAPRSTRAERAASDGAAGVSESSGVIARAIAPDSAVNINTNRMVVGRLRRILITSSSVFDCE